MFYMCLISRYFQISLLSLKTKYIFIWDIAQRNRSLDTDRQSVETEKTGSNYRGVWFGNEAIGLPDATKMSQCCAIDKAMVVRLCTELHPNSITPPDR